MSSSRQDPFGSSLQELVHHQHQVGHDKSNDVKGKELGGVLDAQLEAHQRLAATLETGVFDLTSDAVQDLNGGEKASQTRHVGRMHGLEIG